VAHALAEVAAALHAQPHAQALGVMHEQLVTPGAVELNRPAARGQRRTQGLAREAGLQAGGAPRAQPRLEARLRLAGDRRPGEHQDPQR
jgi:hypothetical protein